MEHDEPWFHPGILPAEIVKVTDAWGTVWVGYHVHEIERGDGGIAATGILARVGAPGLVG